ncbi:MAG: beta-galactosidase [Lentisphaeria bacterium]|nr:beta-galactosidase [Lentisphaeria bacterium]
MKNHFPYGVVLLLQLSDTRQELLEKCRKIRSLAMNTVVFYPPLFYKEGKMDCSKQLELLDVLEECGLSGVAELTGQVYNLEFMSDEDFRPEYLVTDKDGLPAPGQNGLGELNYHHPAVRTALQKFFDFTVNAFKDHPALAAYDVWNETHFKSFDSFTLQEFRTFLREKYITIEELNRIWMKSYRTFDNIRLDPVTWASFAPEADWEEFRVRDLAAILADWVKQVKAIDPHHPVIADNVMSNTVWSEFDRGTDDWLTAEKVDRFGISFYPKTGGRLLKDNSPSLRKLTFAGAASAAGEKGFLISELQSHFYSEIFTTERVAPHEIERWICEALFSHCTGCIFWKYEPFKSGFQTGGRGLVLPDGTFTARADAAHRIGELLEKEPEIRELHPVRKAALLYDRHTNQTIKAVNTRIRHIIGDDQAVRALCNAAAACYALNLPFEIAIPEQIETLPPEVELLILPYPISLQNHTVKAIKSFLARGGKVLAAWPCNDISESRRLNTMIPGGELNPLIGLRALDNVETSLEGIPLEIQLTELFEGTELLRSSDDGYPLFTRRGNFFFAASNPFLLPSEAGKNLSMEFIRNAAPGYEVSPHIERAYSAQGTEFLFIPNEEKLPEIRLKNGNWKLIYGAGVLQKENGIVVLKEAYNTILKSC